MILYQMLAFAISGKALMRLQGANAVFLGGECHSVAGLGYPFRERIMIQGSMTEEPVDLRSDLGVFFVQPLVLCGRRAAYPGIWPAKNW